MKWPSLILFVIASPSSEPVGKLFLNKLAAFKKPPIG